MKNYKGDIDVVFYFKTAYAVEKRKKYRLGANLQRDDLPHLLEIIVIATNQGDSRALGLGVNTNDKVLIVLGADGVVVVFVSLRIGTLAMDLGNADTGVETSSGQDETTLEVLDLTFLVDPLLVVVIGLVTTAGPDDDLCTGIDGALLDIDHQVLVAKLDLERAAGEVLHDG